MSQWFFHRSFVLMLVVALSFAGFTPALAAPPTNDNFANAEEIPSLPFIATLDASEATLEPDEPQTCLPTDRSVWYSFVPTETMVLIADARDFNGPKISIFRGTGAGVADLESVQCVSPGGAITFLVEPGQTYYLQVGPTEGTPGSVQFSLSEVIEISGRITDSTTGAPLSGNEPTFATATLLRICGDDCLEPIRSVAAFSDGQFRFDSYFADPIPPGTYLIEASAGAYQTRQFGPFEFTGDHLAVGDLPIDPLPTIRSIRGRLLDHSTGRPVAWEFGPLVQLFRCIEWDCSWYISQQVPDAEGRFRFDTDYEGRPLPAGTYMIMGGASQYHTAQTQVFEVREGADRNAGTLRLRSFPVRFSDVQPCPDLPASGGECEYSVRVWNGLPAELEGEAWSLASSWLPDPLFGYTDFQVKTPTELELERGRSRVLRFRFSVPPSDGSSDLLVCTRIFVGRGGNPSFNTVGYGELFCMFRTATGFTAQTPGATSLQVRTPGRPASTLADVEPNNTCGEAEDVGAVSLPYSLNGSLDSSIAPDIDFYRFTATAGDTVTIDHEGQSTGQGTLLDPLLGVFDSGCNLIASNDDRIGLNSQVTIMIPADGVFILAATEFPDFDFVGGGNGTYTLTVTPIIPLGSISGTATDALSGAPLPGDAPPFSYAELIHCSDQGCWVVSSQNPGNDGRFSFTGDFTGMPLPPGTYFVAAVADQYQWYVTETFEVGEGEHVDIGSLALTSFPIVFSSADLCEIPSEGGVCEFSITATNTQSERFSGKAWSMVYGSFIGSFVDFTAFQTDTPVNLRLDPGASRTLHFRFRVRSAVPDGAFICAEVTAGENPHAAFTPVGRTSFCVVKGESGFTLMSPQEAQAALQQLKLQQSQPSGALSDLKKK